VSNELGPEDQPPANPPAAPCCHLRSKGMYVYTDRQTAPSHDDYDNTIYWCLKTMKNFGPDDGLVEGPECSSPGRSCYEPL
jgi:hypothetical protein